jgi:hypothetical protein
LLLFGTTATENVTRASDSKAGNFIFNIAFSIDLFDVDCEPRSAFSGSEAKRLRTPI